MLELLCLCMALLRLLCSTLKANLDISSHKPLQEGEQLRGTSIEEVLVASDREAYVNDTFVCEPGMQVISVSIQVTVGGLHTRSYTFTQTGTRKSPQEKEKEQHA